MKKMIEIPLSLIRIDGKTQQRTLCIETQRSYADLMREGVKFPPIEAVFDGMTYWLWDGFHRFFAAKEIGLKALSVKVTHGTVRDAIRLSLSANECHGLRRDKAAKINSVRVVEQDEEWKLLPDLEKAKMTGMSQRYYRQLRTDIPELQTPIGGETSRIRRAQSAIKTHDGTAPETTSEPVRETAPVRDAANQTVPDHLAAVFLRAGEIKEYLNRIDRIKSEVKEAITANSDLWSWFRWNPFEIALANMRRQFRFAVPYAVCPYCGGQDSDKCSGCKGAGFLNEESYKAAPQELK
jgi:hypothetical protein